LAQPSCTDDDFIRLLKEKGPAATAKHLGVTQRGVYARRRSLEDRGGSAIAVGGRGHTRTEIEHPHRVELSVQDGVVLVGSDGHYWPGPASTAHRAFVRFCKELSPSVVVMNGDVFDGATVSRHPPIGWENRPSLVDEIEACRDRLHEVELAVSRRTRMVWTLGNHDARFETRLATIAPEYAKLKGVHLKDHFGSSWEPCWSAWINDTVIKHRFKGGIHATHNATMWAGKTTVTGHLHSLKVTPFSDYNGTRFGVDTGTLADPNGPQFVHYSEDNPKNHRSGFIVLTYRNGRLLWPEIVSVFDANSVEFRGEVIAV
jgi:hypothetical protein